MARWAVVFQDRPEMQEHRRKFGAAHVTYLRLNPEILIGGGFRADTEGPFCGGMWVVDADNKNDVIALVENDPYYQPELRQYDVFQWGKALEDQQVTL